jgi:hypothetical protein
MSADIIKPGSPQYWGPRLWRIFHDLAEISDRRDIGMLWPNILKSTAATMPCSKCRNHLTDYLKHHKIISVTNPLTVTGEGIRVQIRNQLHHLHNQVNLKNNIPEFPITSLTDIYGNRSRTQILAEIHSLMNEVKDAWQPLLHSSINPGDFTNWKNILSLLISLVSAGPN